MDVNNRNIDLVKLNMNAYIKFVEILSRCRAETKFWPKFWHQSRVVTLLQMRKKMWFNNPNLDLVNINAYTKFGEILSVYSEDIERKRNYDGRTDERTDGMTDHVNPAYSPPFSKRGYKNLPNTFQWNICCRLVQRTVDMLRLDL